MELPSIAESVAQIEGVTVLEGEFSDLVDLNDVIGEGAYATIFKATVKSTSEIIAVKAIDLTKVSSSKKVFNEVSFLAKFENSKVSANVYRLNGSFAFTDGKSVFELMKFYERGDLYSFYQTKQGLLENDAKFIIANLINTLSEIHSKSIIYRDLKPENCMIDEHGYVRLIDFNLAVTLEEDELLKTRAGTSGYLAPEVLNAGKLGYDYKADIWCLGCLLYEVLYGKLPFIPLEG